MKRALVFGFVGVFALLVGLAVVYVSGWWPEEEVNAQDVSGKTYIAPVTSPLTAATFAKGKGLKLVKAVDGFKRPVDLQQPPGDNERLFVVEQRGRIYIVKNGKRIADPFLDLGNKPSRLYPYTEQGLLGLAFHPEYQKNRRFFIHYTARDGGHTVVAELTASNNPDKADASSEKKIFGTNQPYINHNGGQLSFGPDGMLYLGLGDGGSAHDPDRNGQNVRTPLGAILRFDVSTPGKAVAAKGNPFLEREDALDEVWVYGLRNPWKFSWNDKGDLYIADVGQNVLEWISIAPAGTSGTNFGWNQIEGMRCHGSETDNCDKSRFVLPVLAYDHDTGCSITGGYHYQGAYFFSDYCTPWVRSFKVVDGKPTELKDWSAAFAPAKLKAVSSFGRDNAGNVYVLDYRAGAVWRIASVDTGS